MSDLRKISATSKKTERLEISRECSSVVYSYEANSQLALAFVPALHPVPKTGFFVFCSLFNFFYKNSPKIRVDSPELEYEFLFLKINQMLVARVVSSYRTRRTYFHSNKKHFEVKNNKFSQSFFSVRCVLRTA